ncbi:MAG: DUF4259 domain-containing protein [Saccharofermentans sp.]|nr:DUF4259 domain-containing protein [Saccharofermentans sp.]
MGAWGAGITSNDTAQDLLNEYKAAFFYYDVATAVKKIDEYVRTMFDETDEEEFAAYYYSLADFMWKKGILTDEIRDRAVKMVDSDFGMNLWKEEGAFAEKERRKVLAKFRDTITSPQCAPKKIKIDYYMDDIFEDGEYVCFQLKTEGKPYTFRSDMHKGLTDEEFHALDGKYVVFQKIKSHVSCVSAIVPEVCDRWAVFRMFYGIFDSPDDIKTEGLEQYVFDSGNPFFSVESTMFHFKKRAYKVIGKAVPPEETKTNVVQGIYLGINRPHYNADSDILSKIYPFELGLGPFEGKPDTLYNYVRSQVTREIGYGHGLRGDKYKTYLEKYNKMINERRDKIDSMLAMGAKLYEIHEDRLLGIAVKVPGRKAELYMMTKDPQMAKMLKEYAEKQD